MKNALRFVSYLGLALSIIPPLLLWAGKLDLSTNYLLLNIGMVLWFGTSIFWVKKHQDA